ncbi:MAG: hypothetical protein WBN81_04750 [Gammaproteobacteria bacterium]
MRTFRHFTVLCLCLVNTASASSGEDVFVGCYSLNHGGEPWIKIEKIEDSYHVSLKDNDGWNEGASLHPGSQQELSDLFENESAGIKSSLLADKGAFALFHVQAGGTYGGYKAATDYIMYILIGAASAHKENCTN